MIVENAVQRDRVYDKLTNTAAPTLKVLFLVQGFNALSIDSGFRAERPAEGLK